MYSQTRRLALPNRIHYPTDCPFASSCSPPHFTMTPLLSATTLWLTPTGTFTPLLSCPYGRTSTNLGLYYKFKILSQSLQLGNQRYLLKAPLNALRIHSASKQTLGVTTDGPEILVPPHSGSRWRFAAGCIQGRSGWKAAR